MFNIYEYCYTMFSKFTSVAYCVIHFDSLLKGIVNIIELSWLHGNQTTICVDLLYLILYTLSLYSVIKGFNHYVSRGPADNLYVLT